MGQLSELRKAVKYVEDTVSSAFADIQELEGLFQWSRFGDSEKPDLQLTSGYELEFNWNGRRLPIRSAIEYMEECGYITPDDFM